MFDNMEVNGHNPYSRNRVSDQGAVVKASSFNQKTQDLLQSFQKSSGLVNNIKSGQFVGGKRVLPVNAQFRKSFGGIGPQSNNHAGGLPIAVRDISSNEGMRPGTSGKKSLVIP